MRTGISVSLIVIFLVFVLPLGIASIVISQTQSDQCDYEDKIGLDIKEYLFIGGIVSVCVAFVVVVFGSIALCISCMKIPIIIVLVLNGLFAIAWFIIGAFILFRSNLECIKEGSIPVVYALVLWCLTAIGFVI